METYKRIVIMTTAGSEQNASAIAKALVDRKLAACVNIVRGVRSVFPWKGEVCDESEFLLLVKTRLDQFDGAAKTISEVSDYECPEIIALPIIGGSESYLEWLDSCLEGNRKST